MGPRRDWEGPLDAAPHQGRVNRGGCIGMDGWRAPPSGGHSLGSAAGEAARHSSRTAPRSPLPVAGVTGDACRQRGGVRVFGREGQEKATTPFTLSLPSHSSPLLSLDARRCLGGRSSSLGRNGRDGPRPAAGRGADGAGGRRRVRDRGGRGGPRRGRRTRAALQHRRPLLTRFGRRIRGPEGLRSRRYF